MAPAAGGGGPIRLIPTRRVSFCCLVRLSGDRTDFQPRWLIACVILISLGGIVAVLGGRNAAGFFPGGRRPRRRQQDPGRWWFRRLMLSVTVVEPNEPG
jgi:hypothetical protein